MSLTLVSLTLLTVAITATPERDLEPRWRDWLQRDVGAVISDTERKYFLSLTADDERERFIEAFWTAHDPTPRSRKNEFREEISKRVAHAESHFAGEGSRSGARSERGRMYVLFGEPQVRREFHSSAYGLYPTELWFYQAPKGLGLPAFFYLMFFKRNGVGAYRLYSPVRDGPEALLGAGVVAATSRSHALGLLKQVDGELMRAAISLDPGSGADRQGTSPDIGSELLLAKVANIHNSAAETRYLESLDLSGEVETAVDYTQVSFDSALWSSRESDGSSWVHYQLVVPPDFTRVQAHGSQVFRGRLELDIVFENDRRIGVRSASEAFDIDLSPRDAPLAELSPLTLQGKLAVIPGRYRVTFLLRNIRTGQFGIAEDNVDVSPPSTTSPTLGRVVLSSSAEPLRGRGVETSHPFAANGHKLLPMRKRRMQVDDNAWMMAQVLYPAGDAPGRLAKTVTVSFDGQEVFGYRGWLEPNPDLDGGCLTIAEQLKLDQARPGTYGLTLVIESEEGRRVADASESFEVVTEALPPAWALSRAADRRGLQQELARQYLLVGDGPGALTALERADGDRLLTASMLLEMNEPARAAALLAPLLASDDAPPMAHVYAALSYAMQGRYPTAAAHYERALGRTRQPSPSLLNALGEAYANAGDAVSARRAFEHSLQIAPEQPNVREVLDRLGG